MVRVAGLKQQLTGEVDEIGARRDDGRRAARGHLGARARARRSAVAVARRALLPKLAEQGVVFVKPETLSPDALAALDERFHNEVFPILTPIAIDPGHPFPHLRNKSLNLGVMFKREGALEHGFGVVQVPMMLPRLLEVPGVTARRAARDARVRAARGPHRAARRDHLPGRAHQGRLRRSASRATSTSRSTRKRPRISSRRSSRSSAAASAETPCASRSPATPPPASLAKLVKALKLDPDTRRLPSRAACSTSPTSCSIVARDERARSARRALHAARRPAAARRGRPVRA